MFPTVSSFSTLASSETSLASFTVTSSEALTILAAAPPVQCTHVYKPIPKLVCVQCVWFMYSTYAKPGQTVWVVLNEMRKQNEMNLQLKTLSL